MLHQQYPAARRRHASCGLPRCADAADHALCRDQRSGAQGEGRADGRRLPRRAHRGVVGEGSRPEILLADQGQAGVVRGSAGGRKHRQRCVEGVVRGAAGRRQDNRRQGHSGGGGAGGGAQGARDDAQKLARHCIAARQARRLPGARSGKVGDFHRRGRLGRRLRQAGSQPRVPGRIAASRQDFECRACRAWTRCCRARKSAR